MPLTDNLISYWELEEASGTRDDAHGANDLTDNNTVGQSASGKVGNCADFEADNSEKLTRADNTDLSAGDISFTFAAWVFLESKTARMNIITKDGPTDGEYDIQWHDIVDRFQFVVFGTSGFGNSGAAVGDALGSPSTATWYFIVAWHDATANTVNIQINNGTVDSAAHSAGVFDGTGVFAIGATDAFGQYFDGLIDQVGFWKRVLTSQERTDLYNSGNGLSYAALAGGGVSNKVPLLMRQRRMRVTR